jgi:hypothetical protein
MLQRGYLGGVQLNAAAARMEDVAAVQLLDPLGLDARAGLQHREVRGQRRQSEQHS